MTPLEIILSIFLFLCCLCWFAAHRAYKEAKEESDNAWRAFEIERQRRNMSEKQLHDARKQIEMLNRRIERRKGISSFNNIKEKE